MRAGATEASGAVLAAPESGGLSLAGVAWGVGRVAHGGAFALSGANNLLNPSKLYAKRNKGKKAADSSKAERHGDGGRTLEKTNPQVEALREQLKTATGTEAKKIKQKIKNIIEAGKKANKGINDNNNGIRN